MTNLEFESLRTKVLEECCEISDSKSIEYTMSSEDKLANFKNIGERFEIEPMLVAGVYMNKHIDSVNNYIKTGKMSAGESLKSRLQDIINYSILMIAIYHDCNTKPTGERSCSRSGDSET